MLLQQHRCRIDVVRLASLSAVVGPRVAWRRRLPLLAAGCSIAVCSVAGCGATGGHALRPDHAVALPTMQASPRHRPSAGRAKPVSILPAIGGSPARIARQLTTAESVLATAGASPGALARQALTVQLACLRIAVHPGWADRVLDQVKPPQRAAAST